MYNPVISRLCTGLLVFSFMCPLLNSDQKLVHCFTHDLPIFDLLHSSDFSTNKPFVTSIDLLLFTRQISWFILVNNSECSLHCAVRWMAGGGGSKRALDSMWICGNDGIFLRIVMKGKKIDGKLEGFTLNLVLWNFLWIGS